MGKYKLTISMKGSELPADKRSVFFETLKFEVKKEKTKPHTLIVKGASPKNIDADLIDKAIKKSKLGMIITDVQTGEDDED
jgi:hypothetical protein